MAYGGRARVRRARVNQAFAMARVPRRRQDGLTGSQCVSSYADCLLLVGQTGAYDMTVARDRARHRLPGTSLFVMVAVVFARTRLATTMSLVLLAAALGTVAAQPPEKMPRVGYISPGSSS